MHWDTTLIVFLSLAVQEHVCVEIRSVKQEIPLNLLSFTFKMTSTSSMEQVYTYKDMLEQVISKMSFTMCILTNQMQNKLQL